MNNTNTVWVRFFNTVRQPVAHGAYKVPTTVPSYSAQHSM
jgi:hypothetical protein